MEELRQELAASQNELTRMNTALKTKLPKEDVEEYQCELDRRVIACFQRIDAYIQSRSGEINSVVTVRSQSLDGRSKTSRSSV